MEQTAQTAQMEQMEHTELPKPSRDRKQRIVIHVDYDAFYATCFELENPALRALPLAVQQKQIVVTCNYEARRRGLHKLQLIKEAKQQCPDLVVVLGEDLTRFRNASKQLYSFLRDFSWNGKVERLGFDEVFLDVTDIVDHNVTSPSSSFFRLSRHDPTHGFAFDASAIAGHAFPSASSTAPSNAPSTARSTSPREAAPALELEPSLAVRLRAGSHLARHIRTQLHRHHGFTATVGVSTSKLLAKLVGNAHKPDAQTTLMPPYWDARAPRDDGGADGGGAGGRGWKESGSQSGNVALFMAALPISAIPGIGAKLAQKLRDFVEQHPHPGTVNDDTNPATPSPLTVHTLLSHPLLTPHTLHRLLSAPGTPHTIGATTWALLHGRDDAPVRPARAVPRQISIEDTYGQGRLCTLEAVVGELTRLSARLVDRMRIDLLDETEGRWQARPPTLRLTTRNRSVNPGANSSRMSRSTPLPPFVFALEESVEVLAERLVREALVPLFRRMYPGAGGRWELGLVNVGVVGIVGEEDGGREGGLGAWLRRGGGGAAAGAGTRGLGVVGEAVDGNGDADPVTPFTDPMDLDQNLAPIPNTAPADSKYTHTLPLPFDLSRQGSEDFLPLPASQHSVADEDDDDDDDDDLGVDADPDADAGTMARCSACGAYMPAFAISAHARLHGEF